MKKKNGKPEQQKDQRSTIICKDFMKKGRE